MIGFSEIILNAPEAVFIRKTDVERFDDYEGFRNGGYAIASDIFCSSNEGVNSAEKFIIKPNVVARKMQVKGGESETPSDDGIVTSVHFVRGLINRLQELGVEEIVVGEGSEPDMKSVFESRGYTQMAAELGVKLCSFTRDNYAPEDINWVPVDGVVFKEIPVVRPVGDPDFKMMNVPTLKTHNLAITTLCTKNLQGAIAVDYRHFCQVLEHVEKSSPEILEHFQPDFAKRIRESFEKHKAMGYPRWDERSYQDEIYCQRACDALLAIKPWICLVEGIIGRDGTAFHHGKDILANLIIAGRHPIHVDTIATYLMGHNTQNVGYLMVAKERGLGENDPRKIEVFLLTDDGPKRCEDIDSIGRLALGVYHRGDTSRYIFF